MGKGLARLSKKEGDMWNQAGSTVPLDGCRRPGGIGSKGSEHWQGGKPK
jgi:hypothetical protein